MAELRKYGVAATFNFPLFEAGTNNFKLDASHASGDSVISKDEGAQSNTTNGFVDEGSFYSLTLTSTEMEAARIAVVIIDQGTKAYDDQMLVIETYGHSSAQHEFDLDAASTPQTGDNYARLGAPAGASVSADVAAVKAETASILTDTAEIGTAGAGLTAINLPDQTMNITGNITGNLSGSVGSVTGLTVAHLDVAVSSRMATYTHPTGFLAATFPGTVASTTNITAGTITTVTNLTNLPTIPANWLTAAGTAADFTTEIQAGLATSANLSTLQTSVDDLPTNGELTAAISGLATAANLATVDTVVDAIKVKTDSLTFTVTGQVDANTESMNGAEILGDGTAANLWRGE